MTNLSTSISYRNQIHKNRCTHGNKNRNFTLKNNNSNLAFKGKLQVLNKIGAYGTNPIIAPLVSTLGILAIRPAITLADKNTPKEDKIYSASWQTGVALGGLGVMLGYGKKIDNLSMKIAEKVMGTKLNPVDKELAKNKGHIVEAVYRNPKTTANILNMSEEKATKLTEAFTKKSSQKGKFSFKSITNSFNPLKIFKKSKRINPFINNPGLVGEIRQNKKVVNDLLKNNAQKAKKILTTSGTSKVTNFGLLMGALSTATFLVTRYLDPLMNFTGKKLNIESLKKEEKNSETNKKKWNKTDKTIFGALGALVLIEGTNAVGKLFKKDAMAYKAIGNIFKGINKNLKITDKLGKLTKKITNKISGNNSFRKKMAGQANVNDKWLERSIWTNLAVRFGINVKAGNPYTTVREAVDPLLQLSLLGLADKTLVKPAQKGLAKLLKVPEHNQGVKVIAEQGVKNLFIVCTVMGFLNNAISHRVINGFKKISGNDKNTKFKQAFLTSQNLKEFNLENYKKSIKPINQTVS